MKIEKTLKLGIYRHYKGNFYEVLSTGRHSETEEWMVIYRTLYGDGGIWIRPFDMFTEMIEVEGKSVERFAYMGKEERDKKKREEAFKKSFLKKLFSLFK